MNFVQNFWRNVAAEPMMIAIDGLLFERAAMTENQKEQVLTSPSYLEAVHDAADFGICYNSERICDNDNFKSHLDSFWSSDELTAEMRIKLGLEVCSISGIAEDMRDMRNAEIKAETLRIEQEMQEEEDERVRLEGLSEESELVSVVDGDELDELPQDVTIEQFEQDNAQEEQVTHP